MGSEHGIRRLAFARLGELNVLDEVVEDLLFVASKTSIVGLVPVEIENASGNAMRYLVGLCILAIVVGLVLAPVGAQDILKLPLKFSERIWRGKRGEAPRGNGPSEGKGRWRRQKTEGGGAHPRNNRAIMSVWVNGMGV